MNIIIPIIIYLAPDSVWSLKTPSALCPRLPLFPSVMVILIKEGKKEFFPYAMVKM